MVSNLVTELLPSCSLCSLEIIAPPLTLAYFSPAQVLRTSHGIGLPLMRLFPSGRQIAEVGIQLNAT